MKKLLIVLALALSAQVASAQMTLLPSQHPVYGDAAKGMDKTIIGYISNIEWDRAQAEASARSGQKLEVIAPDASVVDEGGVVHKCSSAGLSRFSCVNTTKTVKYHEDMIALARTVISWGKEAEFPIFAGWIRLAK